jgi:hypothetical protein
MEKFILYFQFNGEELTGFTAFLKPEGSVDRPFGYELVFKGLDRKDRSEPVHRFLARALLDWAKRKTPEGKPLALGWLVKDKRGKKLVLDPETGEWIPGNRKNPVHRRWVYLWPLAEMAKELQRYGSPSAKKLGQELEKLLAEEAGG